MRPLPGSIQNFTPKSGDLRRYAASIHRLPSAVPAGIQIRQVGRLSSTQTHKGNLFSLISSSASQLVFRFMDCVQFWSLKTGNSGDWFFGAATAESPILFTRE